MLLIITSDKDLTADFLIVELLRRNLPYFRLNSEEMSASAATFLLDQDGVEGRLNAGRRQVSLAQVGSVWYRRAIHPAAAPGLTPSERAFVVGETSHFFGGLVSNPTITWVNPIENVRVAEQKLVQLKLAHELGMAVPRTLVSTDAAALRRFASANATGTICKPIYHGLFNDEGTRHSILTRRVTTAELEAVDVHLCPTLLQEEVPRIVDVRATFIGADVYVAEIGGVGDAVDWRDPALPVTYTAAVFPAAVEASCREMLARLGLLYGAFDFIKTPEGRYVFLEVNPTGEWAWLENALGFPMRDSFVRLLYGGPQRS